MENTSQMAWPCLLVMRGERLSRVFLEWQKPDRIKMVFRPHFPQGIRTSMWNPRPSIYCPTWAERCNHATIHLISQLYSRKSQHGTECQHTIPFYLSILVGQVRAKRMKQLNGSDQNRTNVNISIKIEFKNQRKPRKNEKKWGLP